MYIYISEHSASFKIKHTYLSCGQVVDLPPCLRTCPQLIFFLTLFYAFPYCCTTECNFHNLYKVPRLLSRDCTHFREMGEKKERSY